MAKISIIIPVYNVEKYLDTCVQSVVNQTLKDIEIILVDDESPDSCSQMCDKYAENDERIKVIHKKNAGLGFARNSGLEIATGEYVTFLDSDDFVDLQTYECLYNILKTNNLDAVYYKFKRFVNENEVFSSQIINDIVEYSDENIKELMLDIIASEPSAKVDHKIQCSSCTALYKLNIIKDNNVRFHSERELISEDLIFNLDFLTHAFKIAFNGGEYYHYRVNPSSLTGTVRKDRIEKNIILYDYINQNLSYWLIEDRGKERNDRLFIGNSRSSIKHMLRSKTSGREKWVKQVLDYSIWNDLYINYDWKSLPLYPKLFFFFCCKKHLQILFYLSKF